MKCFEKYITNKKIIPRGCEKGFTLIELLIVVAILGILAAVVLPNIGGFLRTGELAAAVTTFDIQPRIVELEDAISIYIKLHNIYSTSHTYNLRIIVDDILVDNQYVTLDGETTRSMVFNYSTDATGVHELEIGDWKSTFLVLPKNLLPPTEADSPIEIQSPKEGADVPRRMKVQCAALEVIANSGLNIYLLVYHVESGGPWQVQPLVIPNQNGYWETDVYFGRDPNNYPEDTKNQFYLIAIATKLTLEPGQQWYSIPEYVYVSSPIKVRRE